ncbi:MAG: hypothetical protein D6740_04210, partial [Alphaproteobacteria bacterium]
MPAKLRQFVDAAQADGYLAAHRKLQQPRPLLGGPITVRITQQGGGVFIALPDFRKLDPHVFATPARPRWHGGSPGITGVPFAVRGVADGHYTRLKKLSPFGDKYVFLRKAHLELQLTDATATDAATTADRVRMVASWEDAKGNRYTVKCCLKLAAHGLEFPTFGGVVTNHLVHGFTGIGTPLMPTEFAYAAFWGMGEVSKNGKVLAKPRMVHGMLTEYVRTQGYALATDDQVDGSRWHFHLMVPPKKPVPAETRYADSPVPTGFMLPNGKQLPFWHVMFEDLT